MNTHCPNVPWINLDMTDTGQTMHRWRYRVGNHRSSAKELAKQLVDGHDVELWQRDRKIAIFERQPE
jgi:hypothetical protein